MGNIGKRLFGQVRQSLWLDDQEVASAEVFRCHAFSRDQPVARVIRTGLEQFGMMRRGRSHRGFSHGAPSSGDVLLNIELEQLLDNTNLSESDRRSKNTFIAYGEYSML